MFLKNRNISSKIKRSKVTDDAALFQDSPGLQLQFKFLLPSGHFIPKLDIQGPQLKSGKCFNIFHWKAVNLKLLFL